MDFERDVIKFEIIPDLNRHFRARGVELQAIDLRLGVNTQGMDEDESARKVLKVCARGIDSSRPFFIGLVGSRYGWIPPMERWEEFIHTLPEEEREFMTDTFGASVTELEMVYGALNERALDGGHILFYLRDESSYDSMPEHRKQIFLDTDPALRQKLAALRKRIEQIIGRGGADDRCSTYRLEFNPKTGSFRADEFKELLKTQIAAEIEKELEANPPVSTVWEEEKRTAEAHFAGLAARSVPIICDNTRRNVVFRSATVGNGVSSLIARFYMRENDIDDSIVCLCAIGGSSRWSLSGRSILALWCCELAAKLDEQCPDEETLANPEKTEVSELTTLFRSLQQKAYDNDIDVEIFVDDYQKISDAGIIADVLSDDIDTWIGYIGADSSELTDLNPQLDTFGIGNVLDSDDCDRLIDYFQKTFFLELPSELKEEMRQGSSSLQLRTIFQLFESLDSADFGRIRSSSADQIAAINNYLLALWNELKECKGLEGLYSWTLGKMISNLRADGRWVETFTLISASPCGLPLRDIASLARDYWDETMFFRLTSLLSDFVHEDPVRNVWTSGIPLKGSDDKEVFRKAAVYYHALPCDDEMAEKLLVYFIVLSGDPSLASFVSVGEEDYIKAPGLLKQFRYAAPYFAGERNREFLEYIDRLPQSAAILFIYNTERSLWNSSDNQKFVNKLIQRLLAYDIEKMSAAESLVVSAILLGFHDSDPYTCLKRSVEAMMHAKANGIKIDSNVNIGLAQALDKLIAVCRKNRLPDETKYAGMLSELSVEMNAGNNADKEDCGGVKEKRQAGPDFTTTVFQQATIEQLGLKNRIDKEMSAGKGLRALFGRKKKTVDVAKLAELARQMTDAADRLIAEWELDQNSVRMYLILMFAYRYAVGDVYIPLGMKEEALTGAFRLLMNLRYATFGNLDSAGNLDMLLRGHMLLIGAAAENFDNSQTTETDTESIESRFMDTLLTSTGAVVNRLSRLNSNDKTIKEFFTVTSAIPRIKEYVASMKDKDPDIIDLGMTLEELGEQLGLEWRIQ